jgi:hypothetical protein
MGIGRTARMENGKSGADSHGNYVEPHWGYDTDSNNNNEH